MLNMEQMQVILEQVSVPEYQFELHHDGELLYLRGRYKEGDIVTGDVTDQFTRKWLLSKHMVKSELVQTAFKCYVTSLEHRAREHFTYRGRRVFGPHFDVDALWEICKNESLDYRDKPPTVQYEQAENAEVTPPRHPDLDEPPVGSPEFEKFVRRRA